MRVSSAVLIVLGTLALSGTATHAEDANPQALARASALLRQVSAQKQELETANARLTAEVGQLQKKLAHSEGLQRRAALDLQSTQQTAGRAEKALDATRGRLERTEGRLREAIERLRTTKAELRQLRHEQAELSGKLASVEAELADSERKNLQLYELNVELLELYRRKGPLTALLQREPVTGIGNVGIENLLLEYRTKLEDSRRQADQEEVVGGGTPDHEAEAPAGD